jgi:hypothetical protein
MATQSRTVIERNAMLPVETADDVYVGTGARLGKQAIAKGERRRNEYLKTKDRQRFRTLTVFKLVRLMRDHTLISRSEARDRHSGDNNHSQHGSGDEPTHHYLPQFAL